MTRLVFNLERPANEKVFSYGPGSVERRELLSELERQSGMEIEIPLIIGGEEVRTGRTGKIVMPHDHGHVLATYHKAGPEETQRAIKAAMKAKEEWANLPWSERNAVMLRVAELVSRKYRHLLNAATMLGQGKNVFQAEIDSAAEVIDYLRFNAYYAASICGGVPFPGEDSVNRMDYRPLEGFVLAVTPFNFTAIALNLNIAPVIMGNVTLWKPSSTAVLSNHYLMKIYREAGLPDGVINFLPGPGSAIGGPALRHPDFAGLHFTGSNGTFNALWKSMGDNLQYYRNYPRIVGETGGKDFVVAHASADADALVTALVRGAFEYQGQKCSATSRAYIPRSLWPQVREKLLSWTEELTMGDVRDFGNFVNAVIDEKAFDDISAYIEKARGASGAHILAGGRYSKSCGYFVRPTVIEAADPHFVTMEEEIFGPVLTVHIYGDRDYEKTLELCDPTSPYALTGSVFARDRYAVRRACLKLRHAAGNFYINDKTTGAVVGQQPFGGTRASGTNDKAGTWLNLMRWTSPRTIKENLFSPTHYGYPFMEISDDESSGATSQDCPLAISEP